MTQPDIVKSLLDISSQLAILADAVAALKFTAPDDPHWLEFPLRYRPITVMGEFGIKNEFYYWVHEGIDISVPIGTPVYACADSKVVIAGWRDGYGQCVRLEHTHPTTGKKCWTWYGHLNIVSVMLESRIRVGDMIGLSGNTGNTTGPHLHLTVQSEESTFQPPTWSANLRGSMNPRDWLKWPIQ